MMLSDHFSLAEATASQTADRLGINNDPPADMLAVLKKTAMGMEVVRSRLGGMPIIISSWYRSPALNRAVGSKSTSQHIQGRAVDFICPRFGSVEKVFEELRLSSVSYDQLIKEFASKGGGWVHISFSDSPRREALIIDHEGVRTA